MSTKLWSRRAFLVSALAALGCLTSCSDAGSARSDAPFNIHGHVRLSHATGFELAHLANGGHLLTIAETDKYLLLPREQQDHISAAHETDIPTIAYPITTTYLAASSCMDFFRQLGALDCIRMTSTQRQSWSLDEVVEALDTEELLYVGKYSAPDYERILSEGADLAIESTMIYHAPEVAERLVELGIPVLIERSSYESDPLGRLEWIKLYGVLTNRLKEAELFFEQQKARIEELSLQEHESCPTVAFFSIAANGRVSVRKPGDYVSQMIEQAGGSYFLTGESTDNTALSTMSMAFESFYEQARDAEIIIYNSAIDETVRTIDELVAKAPRLADFRAVRSGHVWCTGKNLFQQPTCIADLIEEMNHIFSHKVSEQGALEHLLYVERSTE